MKKVIILGSILLLLSGCVNLNNSSYDQIIEDITSSNRKISNTYRKGYKFYLPIGMYVEDSKDYNEVIKNDKETFYLYIDLISYLNQNKIEHTKSESVYFKVLEKNGKNGYVEINMYKNDKYLVEIAYNYAKIEVIVDKDRVNKTLAEAMIVLSSIDYNDSFLKGLDSDSLLNYKEEMVDIFDKGNTHDTSNFLKYVEEYDGEEETLPDYDLVN